MQLSGSIKYDTTDDYPLTVSGYNLIQIIGEGHFGVVFKVEVLEGPNKGQMLALKKIDLSKCTDIKLEELRRKILLSNSIDHKNLLAIKTTFVASQYLWVLQEFMDCGSLEMILKSHFKTGLTDMNLVATILKETLQGLAYLHQNNQIHRDIKAANILLQKNGVISISDFGLITKLKKNRKNHSIVGSPCWMAPEALDDSKQYDQKADIWSFGITILEILNGKPPCGGLSAMKAIMTIINEEPPRLDKSQGFDDNLVELVESCLQKNKNDRKDASELLKNKFFQKAKGPDYVKDKLLKNITPLDLRLQDYQELFKEELVKMQQEMKPKSHTAQQSEWDFTLSEGSGQQIVSELKKHSEEIEQGIANKKSKIEYLMYVSGDQATVNDDIFNNFQLEEQ